MQPGKPPRISLAAAKKNSKFLRAHQAMAERYALLMARTKKRGRREALRKELVAVQRRQLREYESLEWVKQLYAESGNMAHVARVTGVPLPTLRSHVLGLALPDLLNPNRWRKPMKEIDVRSNDFYLAAGLFTGNGHVTHENSVSIGIEKRTRKAVERNFRRLLKVRKPFAIYDTRTVVHSADLALALARHTQVGERVPPRVLVVRAYGKHYARGLLHASGYCTRRRGRPTQVNVRVRSKHLAEQLAVLLYKHFGILSTATPEGKGRQAYVLRINHPQDLIAVRDNRLLAPTHHERLDDYLRKPFQLQRDFSREVSEYDQAMRLHAQRLPFTQIAKEMGISDSLAQNWVGAGKAEKRVPARAKSYAEIVDLARKHGVKIPFYEHAYLHGKAAAGASAGRARRRGRK